MPGGLQELSGTAGQGVPADPAEETAARTLAMEMPVAVWTATDCPVQEI